ncbi:MAG: N-acetyltransferase [Agathobacter sp.]|nr:N-acetyltransferase [Agathobacter sp.]
MRKIIAIEEKYKELALDFVETVFTEYSDAEEGKLVRNLVEEIRRYRFYLPELELIMLDEKEEIIGYTMFSKFHLEGKYEDELLMLTPVAVKTSMQRQHISKELIDYGFQKATEMGFKAVLVEGNPQNYRARGFVTSADYGIVADESVHLPAKECLMIKELQENTLQHMSGVLAYTDYKSLR